VITKEIVWIMPKAKERSLKQIKTEESKKKLSETLKEKYKKPKEEIEFIEKLISEKNNFPKCVEAFKEKFDKRLTRYYYLGVRSGQIV
jgi:DNA repair exonuclease SbcCD ATPase subunit